MRETDLTEQLDERDLLDDARGPGVYAIECAVPDQYADVEEAWSNGHDAHPPDNTLERLAAARRVAYVGASTHVYDRLCEHIGHTREASFVSTYPPRRVVTVWPHEDPFEAEHNRTIDLVRDDWTVWKDGGLFG
jgi:hypothetical protein